MLNVFNSNIALGLVLTLVTSAQSSSPSSTSFVDAAVESSQSLVPHNNNEVQHHHQPLLRELQQGGRANCPSNSVYHCNDPNRFIIVDPTVVCDRETCLWDLSALSPFRPPYICRGIVVQPNSRVFDILEPCLWCKSPSRLFVSYDSSNTSAKAQLFVLLLFDPRRAIALWNDSNGGRRSTGGTTRRTSVGSFCGSTPRCWYVLCTVLSSVSRSRPLPVDCISLFLSAFLHLLQLQKPPHWLQHQSFQSRMRHRPLFPTQPQITKRLPWLWNRLQMVTVPLAHLKIPPPWNSTPF